MHKKTISNNMSVFVIGHKPFSKPKDVIYKSILVGKKDNSDKDDFDYVDDKSDNIANKNNNFCELTAIYWVWKNIKDCDAVGFSHYRRYFFKKRFSRSLDDVVDEKWVEKKMQKYDIILPEKLWLRKYNVKEQYCALHNLDDLNICRKIIEKKYPSFVESFDDVMQNKWFYPYNMFIMRGGDFDKYCQWLFGIMFEAEKMIDVSKYDDYNKRVFGFLAERLLTVWVLGNGLSVCEAPVNNTEEDMVSSNVKKILKRIIS